MKYLSLGSGSGGNCTVIVSPRTTVMVDCGFSGGDTERRLYNKGVEPASITAIFITHEHGDHHKGVGPFARKFKACVYGTAGTLSDIDVSGCKNKAITCGAPINVSDFTVHPVAVPHDAREPSQFVIENANRRVGILTDIGSITHEVVEHYRHCDSLLLEANYDHDMLWNGPYPYFLKKRIASDKGHLSNDQTAEFLSQIDHSDMQSLVFGHLSEKNNRPDIVSNYFHELYGKMDVRIADQHEGTDWIHVS